MVMPWAPQSRASIFNLIPQRQIETESVMQEVADSSFKSNVPDRDTNEPTVVSTTEVPEDTPEAITATAEPGTETLNPLKTAFFEAADILPFVWLAGALALAVYICANNFTLLRIVRRERPLTNQKVLDLVEDCKAEMGIRTTLGVVSTDKVKSASLFGFVRPRLLLPAGMIEALSREELRYVFLHELAHLKRHDIYLGWLMSLLQVLHWFNPLIWLAFYRMRADRELACDALVLAQTQTDESKVYGRTVVSLLERFSRPQPLPSMAGILETKAQLKRRITMIARFKKNSYQWSPLAVILIILLACVSLPDAKRTKASGISAAKPASALVVRRVWADALRPSLMGAPSPDGKYLAYSDWSGSTAGGAHGAAVAVRELATGKTRRLTEKGSWIGTHPIFSPDSKQVAYAWYNGENKASELRIIGLDGSEPRVLHSDREVQEVGPTDWSTDGKQILVVLYRGESWSPQIALVSIADGAVRVLKSLDRYPEKSLSVSLSPRQEHYVAYSCPPHQRTRNRDIFLLATDGSREIPLVEHPADDFVLGWTPNGKRVVFASDRTGSVGVWVIGMADGKPQGEPELVKPQMGEFSPLGLTRNGSLYYAVSSGGRDVHIATLDPETGKLLASPVKAIQRFEGYNSAPEWSPDGRYLVCRSSQQGPTDHPWTGAVLSVRDFESDQVRILRPKLRQLNPRFLRWSPDGRSILSTGYDNLGCQGLLQIDVETGDVATLARKESRESIIAAEWAPDGKLVFFVRDSAQSIFSTEPRRIVRWDVQTGVETELYRAPDRVTWLPVSPDGRELAFIAGGILKVLPTTGGQPRDLTKAEFICGIAWTPDGRHLLFGRRIGDTTIQLWRVPSEGGKPQKTGLTFEGWGVDVRMHPDGRRIAFASKRAGKNEVWVMENFLPAMPVAKPAHQPNFRKIRIPTKPANGVLSPDGKKLAFVSKGSSIWVVPVHGKVSPDIAGEPVRLPGTKGAWRWGMRWSADGKWIAYNIRRNNKIDEIHVISSTGGEPKKIPVSGNGVGHLFDYRLSLSPDGKVLAFASGEKEKNQLFTVNVEGGDMNQLTEDGGTQPAFSSDGKKIAYVKAKPQKTEIPKRDVWVIPAEGGTPVQVSDLPGRATGPIWSPDGKMIAFTRKAADDASKEICIVPVSETGNPEASPTQIELPLVTWNFLAGWTPDNKIGVLLTEPEHQAIYTVPASGGNATQVTPQGYTFHPRWSPDGKRIFFRWDGIASVPSEGGEISIGPLDADSKIFEALPGGGNAVSPDGKKIVFSGAKTVFRDNKRDYEVDIYTIPIEGGEPKKLTISPGQDRFPCWSPDGKSIAFIRYAPMNICIVPTEGGEVRQLTSESHRVKWSTIAWSPDGKSIAYFSEDKAIKVIPVQGGQPRVVVKVEDVSSHSEVAWSPDGSKLVYSSKGSIWVVSLDEGEPEEIKTGLDAKAGHLSWSPDGKKIAFTAIKGGDAELWLMENFLPAGE